MLSILRSTRLLIRPSDACVIFLLPLLFIGNAYASQPAAGFWEAQSSTTSQPPLTASQIAAFMPTTRGPFIFPSPYNTTGIRVTLPNDCGGTNCVQYIGYNYWARMSNSAGLNSMWIMVALKNHGGPTLYKLDKATNAVSKVGPIFTDANASQDGEMMYFSHAMPNALYYIGPGLTTLNRIDVVTHQETQIFNVNNYQAGNYLITCSSSNDDVVHSCILENGSYKRIGCLVYYSNTDKFQFFPTATNTVMHQCHIGAGGTYLQMNENSTVGATPDTVIATLPAGTLTTIPNADGGSGHSAQGYGYYLQNQNRDPNYDSTKLWNVSDLTSGSDVFDQPWATQCNNSNPTVCAVVPGHPSWLNAVPSMVAPIAHQYACDSTANTISKPFANQVFCYMLDVSVPAAQKKALVVAPTMIADTASGGCANGNGEYGNQPKGNIDPTGHYFIWSANLDSNNNCQVFIVKIPVSQFPYPPPVISPPQVSITAPPNSATVFGTVAAKADVTADTAIANVTWEVDGQTVDTSNTAPYTYDLDTNTLSLGSHTLTAVATDITGNAGTATNDIVIEQAPAPPASSGNTGGASLSFFPLTALGLLAALGLLRKRINKEVTS